MAEPAAPPSVPSEPVPAAAPDERTGATPLPTPNFPCVRCGADLAYAPGTSVLGCPYCGQENDIPAPEEVIVEHDFPTMLARLAEAAPEDAADEVKCGACGALTDRPATLDKFRCAFCGSDLVAPDAHTTRMIRPESLLPFAIEREAAHQAYRVWIGKRWFAPRDFKRYARADGLKGVYIPYWTYDSATTTDYVGERGEYYWETQRYSTVENGKRVTKTRRVRKTRWYPAAGRVQNAFDDILVAATTTLPEKRVSALTPWELGELVPYRQEYLAGFLVERYQVDLEAGFERARPTILAGIDSTIRGDIGGDTQRIHSRDVHYDQITYKHILLPIWVMAYRYRDRVYRILINARTGEVQGDRPISGWKIFFLVAGILLGLLLIIGVIALANAGS